MVVHSNHTRLSEADLTAATISGATIFGPCDETIGKVTHLHAMGPAMRVTVDVGGFLGIGNKTVVLDADRLDFIRDKTGLVHARTPMTKEQMKKLPEHDG